MRQIILLVLALVAGIIAFFSSKSYIEKQQQELRNRFQTVKIVVAAKDLPAGTTLKIDSDMLDTAELPQVLVSQGAVPYGQQAFLLDRRRTQRNIKKGSAIFWADLEGTMPGVNTLSDLLKKGEIKDDPVTLKRTQTMGARAISIPVDLVASVTQMVVPGDRVDIIGTFTFPSAKPDPTLDTVTLTILQDVLVLATGKITTMDMGNPAFLAQQLRGSLAAAYSTVTLEVTPEEAELIAFAIRRGGGNLVLSLRHREDVTIVWKPQSINFEYLEKHLTEFNIRRQKRMGRTSVPPAEAP